MSIELVMPSNHLILCRPLLLLPSSFPSIRVFSNESVLHIRWPKYWNFIFSINPSNEYSGLISFRIDWLDLIAVQGTLKSLLQHHSSKASLFWCSALFTVQLSHPYMTTRRSIAVSTWTLSVKYIPPHPQKLASKIKQTSLSTNLAFLLSFEDRTPESHFWFQDHIEVFWTTVQADDPGESHPQQLTCMWERLCNDSIPSHQ